MDLTERILAAYRSVPGLRLTITQASRLWAVDPAHCERLLHQLVTDGHLCMDPRGRYAWMATARVLPSGMPGAHVSEAVAGPPTRTCA